MVQAEVDTSSLLGSIDFVSSVVERKLRKIEEKESDHGHRMKGTNRLNIREAVCSEFNLSYQMLLSFIYLDLQACLSPDAFGYILFTLFLQVFNKLSYFLSHL